MALEFEDRIDNSVPLWGIVPLGLVGACIDGNQRWQSIPSSHASRRGCWKLAKLTSGTTRKRTWPRIRAPGFWSAFSIGFEYRSAKRCWAIGFWRLSLGRGLQFRARVFLLFRVLLSQLKWFKCAYWAKNRNTLTVRSIGSNCSHRTSLRTRTFCFSSVIIFSFFIIAMKLSKVRKRCFSSIENVFVPCTIINWERSLFITNN